MKTRVGVAKHVRWPLKLYERSGTSVRTKLFGTVPAAVVGEQLLFSITFCFGVQIVEGYCILGNTRGNTTHERERIFRNAAATGAGRTGTAVAVALL